MSRRMPWSVHRDIRNFFTFNRQVALPLQNSGRHRIGQRDVAQIGSFKRHLGEGNLPNLNRLGVTDGLEVGLLLNPAHLVVFYHCPQFLALVRVLLPVKVHRPDEGLQQFPSLLFYYLVK